MNHFSLLSIKSKNMKKLSFFIICSFLAINCLAQNNAYNMGYGWGRYDRGVSALCEGDFSEAFDYFEEGANYHPMCYEGIGICYELGFGVEVDYDEAWDAYTTGANAGVQACKLHLKRINRDGYWPKSYRKTFLANLRNAQGNSSVTVPNVGGYGGGYDNSSGSNSVYTTCRICGGSGVCKSCGGRGGEWRDTGYYTGSNVQSWIACPSCRGNKQCFNCHGTGRQ